jgi:hypothetical protein
VIKCRASIWIEAEFQREEFGTGAGFQNDLLVLVEDFSLVEIRDMPLFGK